jgi:hypothetical protein
MDYYTNIDGTRKLKFTEIVILLKSSGSEERLRSIFGGAVPLPAGLRWL